MQSLIDSYSKSTPRSRVITIAVLGFIAAAASFSWLVYPHFQSLQAVERFSKRADTFGKKIQQITTVGKLAQTNFEKISTKLDEAQKQLFTYDESQSFFSNLESLAAQGNCTVTSVKLLWDENSDSRKQPDPNACVTVTRAAVSINGNFAGVMRFLNEIKDIEKKVSITDMAIIALADKSGRIECSMVVGLYVIDPKGALSK